MGHRVKLMPAEFVKAVNIRNKNDAADARAIWLAVQRPSKPGMNGGVPHDADQRAARNGDPMGRSDRQVTGRDNEGDSRSTCKVVDRLPAAFIDTLREHWNRVAELGEQIALIERCMREWKKDDRAVKAISEIPAWDC